jgi:GTP-sensing pleiotropic transcriptional regulator CodY
LYRDSFLTLPDFLRQMKIQAAAGALGDALNGICQTLRDAIGAEVVIFDGRAVILGRAAAAEPPLLDAFIRYGQTVYQVERGVNFLGWELIVAPFSELGLGGALVAWRKAPFGQPDFIAGEIAALVAALRLQAHAQEDARNAREDARNVRERALRARAVLDALSFSELEAMVHIFGLLGQDGGLVVARQAAEEIGVARSVIVNALRKLQSAGAVEARSLGAKGTHIKILDKILAAELKKLGPR